MFSLLNDRVSLAEKCRLSWSSAQTTTKGRARASRASSPATSGAKTSSHGRQENIQGTNAEFALRSVLAGLTSGSRAFVVICSARCVEGPSIPPTSAHTLSW